MKTLVEETADRFPTKTPDRCRIMLKVIHYVESRPNGMMKLEQFLQDGKYLFGVKDVCEWTGWSASWIRKLCEANKLPHIPGKEIKFIQKDVIDALQRMQRGGEYRNRRSGCKMRKKPE